MARTGRSDRVNGRWALALLITLSVALLITQRNDARERRTTPLLTQDMQAPMATWLGAPIRKIEDVFTNMRDSRQALEENRALRAELAALRAETNRLEAMRLRLRRLEDLMDVNVTGDIPTQRITTRVISDPSGPFVRSYLVGAGRENSVSDGMPVMSDHGLVGHVVSTGRHSARVLRLDDLNSRVAVMSERSQARAILAGENSDIAALAFVSDPDEWQVGDRVLTSGDDGQLPQGLPVGDVIDSNGQLSVRLDFREAPTDWVVILPFEGMADPDDVDAEDEEGGVVDAETVSSADTAVAGESG